MNVVNLSTEKWLGLCAHAEAAARMVRPEVCADLANTAGRLTTCTPPYKGMGQYALFMSFRWDCTAFGLAEAPLRARLSDALADKARLVREMLAPATPDAGAAALPVPEQDVDEPGWARRADIGG